MKKPAWRGAATQAGGPVSSSSPKNYIFVHMRSADEGDGSKIQIAIHPTGGASGNVLPARKLIVRQARD